MAGPQIRIKRQPLFEARISFRLDSGETYSGSARGRARSLDAFIDKVGDDDGAKLDWGADSERVAQLIEGGAAPTGLNRAEIVLERVG